MERIAQAESDIIVMLLISYPQDFVVSIVLTLFWLIGSSAWAAGVSDLKMYTDPDDGSIFEDLVECQKQGDKYPCATDSEGNFASLNVSIVSGLLDL